MKDRSKAQLYVISLTGLIFNIQEHFYGKFLNFIRYGLTHCSP